MGDKGKIWVIRAKYRW